MIYHSQYKVLPVVDSSGIIRITTQMNEMNQRGKSLVENTLERKPEGTLKKHELNSLCRPRDHQPV